MSSASQNQSGLTTTRSSHHLWMPDSWKYTWVGEAPGPLRNTCERCLSFGGSLVCTRTTVQDTRQYYDYYGLLFTPNDVSGACDQCITAGDAAATSCVYRLEGSKVSLYGESSRN